MSPLRSPFVITILVTLTWISLTSYGPAATELNKTEQNEPVTRLKRKDVAFTVVSVKRVRSKKLVVVAVHVDYDSKKLHTAYSKNTTFIADGQEYDVISSDGFRTASQSGRDHYVLEWFHPYEDGSALAEAKQLQMIAEFGYYKNPQPLRFLNLPIEEID